MAVLIAGIFLHGYAGILTYQRKNEASKPAGK